MAKKKGVKKMPAMGKLAGMPPGLPAAKPGKKMVPGKRKR